jgi:hypothetical protein
MTIKSRLFPVVALLAMTFPRPLRAQDKIPVKFGKVTPDDFKVTAAALDTVADVVVVADFATSSYDGNAKGWFDLVFHRSKRLRIQKRTGFNAATIEIPLYVSGTDIEKITSLKASTYTLEDGKVVETKLDSKSIFTDKISKYLVEEKFTFPALKEGAILEYSYTLTSPFWRSIQPWEFQGEYPCLWSEYQVDIPNFFKFNLIGQGNLSFKVNSNDSRPVSYHVTVPGGAGADDHLTVDDMLTTHRWVMANVPPLKEEPYTTTVGNYVAKLDFYLTGYQIPGETYHDEVGNWANKCDELMKNEYFGADLGSGNSWMDDDLKTITKGAANNLEKAQKIFAYVRDNFTCTSSGAFWLSNSLKTVYKTKNGNEADLNLLLTAMLIHAGLDAKPVILSTRGHGVVGTLNPVLNRFNYVIDRVTIESAAYCLDASEPWLGFGRLPQRCYNGAGRVVDKENTYLISLSADSLTEGDVTLVIINNDEKGGLTARVQTKPGNQKSEDMRQDVKEHGQQAYLKRLQTVFAGDATVANLEMDSVLQPDEPLNVAYDLHLNTDSTADLYYFNPMLAGVLKENPFKAAVRTYPVEMPHAVDETYSMMMDIPAGYVVDELPKSAKVLYNTDEGFFEYLMIKGEDQIQFRTRIKLKKATYTPEDYASLRDFYAYVVKKQGEQIVFKKKK